MSVGGRGEDRSPSRGLRKHSWQFQPSLFEVNLEMIVPADASSFGLGAVLKQ